MGQENQENIRFHQEKVQNHQEKNKEEDSLVNKSNTNEGQLKGWAFLDA